MGQGPDSCWKYGTDLSCSSPSFLYTSSLKGYILWKKLYVKIWFLTRGGRGGMPVSDFSDEWGGDCANFWLWLTRWGGVVWNPPFLADVICEQPLIKATLKQICLASYSHSSYQTNKKRMYSWGCGKLSDWIWHFQIHLNN